MIYSSNHTKIYYCPNCGSVFNIFINAENLKNICSKCGSELKLISEASGSNKHVDLVIK